ncbi:MAG: right-handed parallel beta-helix repeat-containing protein, partial [Pseudomonadota bacterium]
MTHSNRSRSAGRTASHCLGLTLISLMLSAAPLAQAQSGPICSASALTTALASAVPGDRVRLGDCTISGSFTVGAGVRLVGTSTGTSIITSDSGAAITLQTAAATPHSSILRRVNIDSTGLFGVLVTGDGDGRLREVQIGVSRGAGVATEQTSFVKLRDVLVVGTVTDENALSIPLDPSPLNFPTHGVVAIEVDTLKFQSVFIQGFATFGALVVHQRPADSASPVTGVPANFRWEGGGASTNITAGLVLRGGRSTLVDVSLSQNALGQHPADNMVVGAGIADGAIVRTTRLTVDDNPGWGVFHEDAGFVRHQELSASRNDHAGLWYQNGPEVRVQNSTLTDNAFGGLVLLNTPIARVDGLDTLNNFTAVRSGGEAGDGVQAVGVSDLRLVNVNAIDNERGGVIIDVPIGLSFSEITRLDQVTVQGSGASFGFIAQQNGFPLPTSALVPPEVIRIGTVNINDAVFESSQIPVGVTGQAGIFPIPCFLPQSAGALSGGLDSI